MAPKKSKKGRKPSPKGNSGSTTNIEADSWLDILGLNPANWASLEHPEPSIPSTSPKLGPKATKKGGKKRKVTFEDDVESSRRKKTKTKDQKNSSKTPSKSSRSTSNTISKREGLRSGSRRKDNQTDSDTTEDNAQTGGNAAESKKLQTRKKEMVPENDGEAFNLAALPAELRELIWANAAGYEGPVRIIEVRINQTSISNTPFTIDSPEGPYHAPDIRAVMASPEGLRQFNARFPHRLQFPGSRDIYFNAARDIIYMDLRSLWSLDQLNRRINYWALYSINTFPRPDGFFRIRNLATPLEDNDIRGLGIHGLTNSANGQLTGVLEPIRTLRDVPDAIETMEQFNSHFTAMYWRNSPGHGRHYLETLEEKWSKFFGPPT